MLNTLPPIQVTNISPRGEEFISYVQEHTNLSENDIKEIRIVCEKIESDGYKPRSTGDPYETHLYEVSELYITLFGRDVPLKRIKTALLHDSIEDILTDSFDSLSGSFGEEIAIFVALLSKTENTDNAKRKREYNSRFSSIDNLSTYIGKEYPEKFGAKLGKKRAYKIAKMIATIKICDRIHNLTTMPLKFFSKKAIRSKLNETKNHYLNIARELSQDYPELFQELQRAIFYVETRLIRAVVKSHS